jgi:hypothetical protein
MNIEQLKEQIYYYTGKKVEVNEDDVRKADKFIENAKIFHKERTLDELIDIIRHDLYLYYQYTYNMDSSSCNNSFDKKRLTS